MVAEKQEVKEQQPWQPSSSEMAKSLSRTQLNPEVLVSRSEMLSDESLSLKPDRIRRESLRRYSSFTAGQKRRDGGTPCPTCQKDWIWGQGIRRKWLLACLDP